MQVLYESRLTQLSLHKYILPCKESFFVAARRTPHSLLLCVSTCRLCPDSTGDLPNRQRKALASVLFGNSSQHSHKPAAASPQPRPHPRRSSRHSPARLLQHPQPVLHPIPRPRVSISGLSPSTHPAMPGRAATSRPRGPKGGGVRESSRSTRPGWPGAAGQDRSASPLLQPPPGQHPASHCPLAPACPLSPKLPFS